MARHKDNKWYPFWQTLKEGYDHFETHRRPPVVTVCDKRYHVNATPIQKTGRVDAEARCPQLERPKVEPFKPTGTEQVAEAPIIAPGPKMRGLAGAQQAPSGEPQSGILSGLTKASPAGVPSVGFSGGN